MRKKIEVGEWEVDEHGERTSTPEDRRGRAAQDLGGVPFPLQVYRTMRSIWGARMRTCDRRGHNHRKTLSVCGQAPHIFMYREMRFMEILQPKGDVLNAGRQV